MNDETVAYLSNGLLRSLAKRRSGFIIASMLVTNEKRTHQVPLFYKVEHTNEISIPENSC